MTKFWIPLEANLLKLGWKQDEVFSSEEISNATSTLEFPDIFNSQSIQQNLIKGQPLPTSSAGSLNRF